MNRLVTMDTDYVDTCTQMTMTVQTTEEKCQCIERYNAECIGMDISYGQIFYKEIKNTRAHTIETLLGSIGGYVGRK